MTRAWSSSWPAAARRRTRCAPAWASAGTFLGWLEGDALARAYASADLFLFCSQTDTFGQVVLEAQASGLPVVAVAAGGLTELIDSGRTGMLVPARASALADAVAGLAASPAARSRLARGGFAAVRERTWGPRWPPSARAGCAPSTPARRPPARSARHDRKHHRTTRPGSTAPPARHAFRRRRRPAANLKVPGTFGVRPGDTVPFAHLPDTPLRRRSASERCCARPRPVSVALVERRRCGSFHPSGSSAWWTSALFYGERSGGIRTYLDAKAAYAARTGAFEHRLVIPGAQRDVSEPTCALPSVRVAASNGYRWPLGSRPLVDLLHMLEPDVVLLHDPFLGAARCGGRRAVGRRARGDGPSRLARARRRRAARPGRLYRPALGRWLKRVYATSTP